MNNKIKLFGVMVLFLISIAAISGAVSAIDATIQKVVVDDTELENGVINILDVDKGEEIEVKVTVKGGVNTPLIEKAQISAYIRGTERDTVEDITDSFDIKSNVSYTKKLNLKLPQRLDQGTYTLRIRLEDKSSSSEDEERYHLDITSKRHLLEIRDVVLNPENEVKAGRALLTTVRVKNRGQQDEEDIKVKVSIPALGISASDYIDELDQEDGDDDSTTSEELYMRIPADAETGEYTVKVEVTYDDGDEKETETTVINIVGDGTSAASTSGEAKTIITVGPESQEIAKGEAGVVYPVTLSNAGTTARTYTVTAEGADWAEFRISPANLVTLNSGESQAVYVYVTAKDSATVGENSFSVKIKSGDTTLKEVALKADVTAPTSSGWSKVKKALEVGLVILVVLLVILGLIIGFNKLKGSEEGEEGKDEDSQTYY